MADDGSKDINDVFDDILLAEEKIIGDAFREGLKKGKKDGELDGFHMGYHRGAEIGAEIGFYKGVLTAISNDTTNFNHKNSEKILNMLEKFRLSLNSFPKINDHTVDVQVELDHIRSQYRKMSSVMKLNLLYPTSSKLSF